MKCQIVTFLFALTLVKLADGQDRLSNWVFADSVGINFDSYSLFETVMSSVTSYWQVSEATACISSAQGNLLLYSNGDRVWNANGYMIEDSLRGYNSACNGVIILPSITDSNQYIVLSIYPSGSLVNPPGLYATTIDMGLNGGEGGVVSGMENVLLVEDTLGEKILAVRHANGRDWWIITSEAWTNGHYIFLYSPQGIQLMQEQFIGNIENGIGEITASLNGNLIATAVSNNWGNVAVYDFDRCTGTLSNYRNRAVTTYDPWSGSYYGCSISPDGSKLYYSNWDTLFQSIITPDSLTNTIVIWIDTV